MIVLSLAAAWAAATVAPPAALDDTGSYVLRNDTSRAFTCGLRRRHRTIVDRFVIRQGEEWRHRASREGVRMLQCDGQIPTPRWRVRSGFGYRLVEDAQSRRLLLLPLH